MQLQRLLIVLLCLILFSLTGPAARADAQVRGDDAELGRLLAKAEDAMAADDPDGAASMMGRAALLATQMSKRQEGWKTAVLKGREALYRAQEHTYRGMALFKRAGGQLPASSGVCGSFALAYTSLRHAADESGPGGSDPPAHAEFQQLHEAAAQWKATLDSLTTDYQCP